MRASEGRGDLTLTLTQTACLRSDLLLTGNSIIFLNILNNASRSQTSF